MVGVQPETLRRKIAGTHVIPRAMSRSRVTFRLGAVRKFVRESSKAVDVTKPQRLSLVRRKRR